eukprot:scaffold3396_cov49-Cyclotella_meneghiniana.AAC.2
MLATACYDGDILEGAKRWTGKEPMYLLVLPNLSMGNRCTVFLEECYLDTDTTSRISPQNPIKDATVKEEEHEKGGQQ